MAFKIANSRPKKMQKRIAAFDDTGEDDSSLASSSKEATAALGASAQTWIDKGSTYAQAGDPAAALRCWDQAALVSAVCDCISAHAQPGSLHTALLEDDQRHAAACRHSNSYISKTSVRHACTDTLLYCLHRVRIWNSNILSCTCTITLTAPQLRYLPADPTQQRQSARNACSGSQRSKPHL